jgi:2-polyprenyl-3-methyl-5-hydroxy-6-metoxy-1,4-benzoquinol methylase
MSTTPAIATPAELSATARRAYARAPLLLRLLQRYRPFICPFEHLLALVPPNSRLLDVGCGGGLLLTLLAASGRVESAVGFDSSAPAISTARAAAEALGPAGNRLTFHHHDARAPWPADPPLFDAVTIIDVMHHVPPHAHAGLISTAAARLKNGGRLIYKDMARRPLWRALANRAHDLLMARQWINYAPIEHVEAWARDAGLTCSHRATHNRFWYGHELRVFEKPPA